MRRERAEDWGCGGRTPPALTICFLPSCPAIFFGFRGYERGNYLIVDLAGLFCYDSQYMNNKPAPKIISRVASKKVLKQNAEALKSYRFYKETSDLLDRADIALGRKTAFKAATGSTLNFEIEAYGTYSTTANKI